MTVGATDARFFRRLGTTSYGFGLFSTDLSFEDYGSMFHGDDERVDVESLRLSTELWEALSPTTCSAADGRAIRAVFFDFGGVILSSPFEAFNRYEERERAARRLHPHAQRHQPRHQRLGAASSAARSTFDEFCDLFEAECRDAGPRGRRPAR